MSKHFKLPKPAPRKIPGYKVQLLNSLPSKITQVVDVIWKRGGFGLNWSNKYEASIKSGYLCLKPITTGSEFHRQIRFLELTGCQLKFPEVTPADSGKKRFYFTIEKALEKLTLKVSSLDSLLSWRNALEAEITLEGSLQEENDLKNYLVLDSFGKGSFGEVNIVLKNETREIFAIKRVSVEGVTNGYHLQERVILEKINIIRDKHGVQSLLKLYHAFNVDDDLFMLTEAYEGGDLFEFLKTQPKRRLSESNAKYIIGEVIYALKYLHMYGIAHRDLKPENLMLDGLGRLKLVDFGLSSQFLHSKNRRNIDESLPKSFDEALQTENLSFRPNYVYKRSFQVVGTCFYQAPEMLDGYGHDLSIDWWQLGCITYEILYGRPLFVADSSQGVQKLIKKNLPIKFPKEPEVSETMKNFISDLLIVEPTDRLGYVNDAEDLMNHAAFDNFDWLGIQSGTFAVPDIFKPAPEVTAKYDSFREGKSVEEYKNLQEYVDTFRKAQVNKKHRSQKMRRPKLDNKSLKRIGIKYIYDPYDAIVQRKTSSVSSALVV